jgi:hypothetical protein
VAGHLGPEQGNEVRRHVLEVVRDIEANDLGTVQGGLEPARELGAMRSLHAKDGVSPLEQLGCHRVIRVGVDSGGRGLDARPVSEDVFRRRTAKPVLAADEEDFMGQGFSAA